MENYRQPNARRQFITTLTGAGSALLLNPLLSWAGDDIDPRVAAIVAGWQLLPRV